MVSCVGGILGVSSGSSLNGTVVLSALCVSGKVASVISSGVDVEIVASGWAGTSDSRGCGQSILSHITIQQICTDAKYDDVCLAYRVAIPRQRFSSKNVFSTM